MGRMEHDMAKVIQEIEHKTSPEKRRHLRLLIEIAAEVVKRCPYLSQIPPEEEVELIRILKEKELI